MSVQFTSIDNDGGGQLPVGTIPPGTGLSGLLWYLPCTGAHFGDYCPCAPSPVIITATMIGAPGQLYEATMLFRGVFEINIYSGGSRSGYFYTGGVSSGVGNQYKLEISDPPQVYWLNAADAYPPASICQVGDYSEPIQIRTGATVTLSADATDATEVYNRDSGDNPLTVPDNVPGYPIRVAQPFNGQFMQMDVTAITPI